jgi:hypothetical protein
MYPLSPGLLFPFVHAVYEVNKIKYLACCPCKKVKVDGMSRGFPDSFLDKYVYEA